MTNLLTVIWGDRDEKKAWKAMQARADDLPDDYRAVYHELKSYLWKFTADDGKDIVAVLTRILGLFETSVTEGKRPREVTGPDLAAFVDGYLPDRPTYEEVWRDKLNRHSAKNRD